MKRSVSGCGESYDELAPREGVEKLLEEAALQSDQDELTEEADAISLMTVHASKGLEFDIVFVTGLRGLVSLESKTRCCRRAAGSRTR